MKYGILRNTTNTGKDSELLAVFAAPLNIISNMPAYVQDTNSLKRVAQGQGVQRWEIESNIEPSNNSAEYLVHSTVNGSFTPIYLRMPQVYGIEVSPAGIITTANVSAGVNTVAVSAAMQVGEFVKFDNHNKVYLVTSVLGNNITVMPNLTSAIPLSTIIKTGGLVTMRAFYDTNVRTGITYIDGVLSDPGSIRFIEAL